MDSQSIPSEWLTAQTTMQEIVETCGNPDPKVAAMAQHYLNQASSFIQQMQAGDELWNYSTPNEAWAENRGMAGLAICRAGQIIDSICLARN
ncbi:hypothetical protein GC197_01850 [bacterium]|nr:hypothetical protein [bacterium]